MLHTCRGNRRRDSENASVLVSDHISILYLEYLEQIAFSHLSNILLEKTLPVQSKQLIYFCEKVSVFLDFHFNVIGAQN